MPTKTTRGNLQSVFPGTCALTGKPIKPGDPVRYVEGKGLVLITPVKTPSRKSRSVKN